MFSGLLMLNYLYAQESLIPSDEVEKATAQWTQFRQHAKALKGKVVTLMLRVEEGDSTGEYGATLRVPGIYGIGKNFLMFGNVSDLHTDDLVKIKFKFLGLNAEGYLMGRAIHIEEIGVAQGL